MTSLLAPRRSLAIEDTLKSDRSVVTLSWLGERSIREVTCRAGHCVVRLPAVPLPSPLPPPLSLPPQHCAHMTVGIGEAGFASLSDIFHSHGMPVSLSLSLSLSVNLSLCRACVRARFSPRSSCLEIGRLAYVMPNVRRFLSISRTTAVT